MLKYLVNQRLQRCYILSNLILCNYQSRAEGSIHETLQYHVIPVKSAARGWKLCIFDLPVLVPTLKVVASAGCSGRRPLLAVKPTDY
jgi:hypothetical protein